MKASNALIDRFKDFIATENLFNKGNELLLAVSGGVDSVVLCELCFRCNFSFNIAHCNFMLRAKDSDEDAQFVKALAAHYSVPYFEREFDTSKFAGDHKLSIQVAARDLRYEWFYSLINLPDQKPINYILTAHHADDNIETMLMNFFKGTGINGLKGILPKHDKIIRPLLFATKDEIRVFAKENNVTSREDASNNQDKYTRNYFRNELIPGIEKVFPSVHDNLKENAERFRDIHNIYEAAIKNILKKIIKKNGQEIHIPVLLLTKTTGYKTILYEIIKEYGFASSQVGEVDKLLNSESGKYVQSATHRILRNRKWLIISLRNSDNNSYYLIEEGVKEIEFEQHILKISFQEMPVTINSSNFIAQLDPALIQFPLMVRKWKKGDYFYPLGMNKKKKLSRFFIDVKLSLTQKESTWIIESNKKIIWIVGQRIDNRYKITGKTKQLLEINWLPAK